MRASSERALPRAQQRENPCKCRIVSFTNRLVLRRFDLGNTRVSARPFVHRRFPGARVCDPQHIEKPVVLGILATNQERIPLFLLWAIRLCHTESGHRPDCLREAHINSGYLLCRGLGSQRLGALRRPRRRAQRQATQRTWKPAPSPWSGAVRDVPTPAQSQGQTPAIFQPGSERASRTQAQVTVPKKVPRPVGPSFLNPTGRAGKPCPGECARLGRHPPSAYPHLTARWLGLHMSQGCRPVML